MDGTIAAVAISPAPGKMTVMGEGGAVRLSSHLPAGARSRTSTSPSRRSLSSQAGSPDASITGNGQASAHDAQACTTYYTRCMRPKRNARS
eukprot:scaffold31633_cov96-Isochrysis_galbana.AAC.3